MSTHSVGPRVHGGKGVISVLTPSKHYPLLSVEKQKYLIFVEWGKGETVILQKLK